jgi:hypothetical protein
MAVAVRTGSANGKFLRAVRPRGTIILMARPAINPGSLHVAWNLPSADAISVKTLGERLVAGHDKHLFNLHSWDLHDGKIRATLTPEAPLAEIIAVIWGVHQPNSPGAASGVLGACRK